MVGLGRTKNSTGACPPVTRMLQPIRKRVPAKEENDMNTIPGFNAELSAYRSHRNYRAGPAPDAHGGGVRLQACDLACLGECRTGCADLAGRERVQCLRLCNTQCGCGPIPLQCGPCQCDPLRGWTQRCCRPDGTGCSRRACTPPGEGCTVEDNRTCLPWPFDSICWGSCTRTCCHWSGCDQRLCGVSPC